MCYCSSCHVLCRKLLPQPSLNNSLQDKYLNAATQRLPVWEGVYELGFLKQVKRVMGRPGLVTGTPELSCLLPGDRKHAGHHSWVAWHLSQSL